MILPKLVQERPYSDIIDWPKLHLWGNGTMIVEERHYVLIWEDDPFHESHWRRYEWAALSDFPKPDTTLEGLKAIQYILARVEPLSKTDT